ncbi:EcoAI/FtnUII family type I restriction enzme subunit R [Sorangium sp. So ce1504]|uniref:EcoAI/FtnUII family type I restriction enzme subunit R n=1 Tax=Sorangium sp. So ce1504 TaxID=3133337 RepID=UPI003F5E4B7E
MNKKDLSERDVCTKYITPAIVRGGWDVQVQVRENVHLTKGRVIVRGKLVSRGKAKFADYVLYFKPNLPLAIVEAKDNNHGVGDGMQQGLGYAEMLDVPFVFSSNGDGFLFHDRTGQAAKTEEQLTLDQFPSPEELWRRYCAWKAITPASEAIVAQDYYSDASKAPRYYQVKAVNRVIEAVAKGQDRILLVMATGTGKTYTAFQIIWRLWKAGVKKRILFLADRNILIDQTKTNDFKPFGGAMTKITNRKVDKSFEIYLALYQAISGTEEEKDIFRQFSPEFFDLIIVDECHRGSAADNSAWREVLDYFSSATQVGLTATPKETADISTTHYFGEAVYTYSLKQGIEDGFLAPYKVVRIDLDKDLAGWRPERGKLDKFGQEIEDRIYNQRDFDRTLVLEKRTELVAQKVTQFLAATDRFDKTIVFCEDIDHAERMRQALVNQNGDLCAQNRKYVMRITGDNPEGKAELDNFIHPEERYPVVVTTSKLMTTGVDAKTCKIIVLDQTIRSMTEFKQIIGRGTRIDEDYGKLYFTILDFRKATELFADPDFDGNPVQVYRPDDGDSIAPPDEHAGEDAVPGGPDGIGAGADSGPGGPGPGPEGDGADGGGKRIKYVVQDVPVYVVAERVQYYGKDGKLITESLRDYSKNAIRERFTSLDAFLKTWSEAHRKQAIIKELEEQGVFFEELAKEVGKELSAFDLICHVAFDQPPLTRKERANNVRKRNYFTKFGDAAQAVLEALLDKFEREGVDDIENIRVLQVQPISQLGTPVELVQRFGGKGPYLKAVRGLEDELYEANQGPKSA